MIDEDINNLIKIHFRSTWILSFYVSNWEGVPWRSLSHKDHVYFSNIGLRKFISSMEKKILEAGEAECLTSKYKYIREYKKWTIKENE